MLVFHDKEGNYYRFLPRVWPNYIQQHLKYTTAQQGSKTDNNLILKLPMEEDVFDYLKGLHDIIYSLTNEIMGVITKAYQYKKASNYKIDPKVNMRAMKMMHFYDFKHF